MFVDDAIITEVYQVDRMEQSAAAAIEALFIILGDSDILVRQDPISWDKLYKMMINFINKILRFIINTRAMTIEAPPDYIAQVVKLLTNTRDKKSFAQAEMANSRKEHYINETMRAELYIILTVLASNAI